MSQQQLSTEAASESGERSTTQNYLGYFSRHLRDYGILLAFVAILIFFQIVTDGILLKPLNVTNLILQNSYIVIMALGMLMVIVLGHIDLSVGSVAGFIGALAAVLMVNFEMHYIPATTLCLAAGGLIGAAQGFWVAYYKIPAFIVTLAGMLIFRGLSLAVLEGQSVGPFPAEFQKLSSGFIGDLFSVKKFHLTSMILGSIVALILAYMQFKTRANQEKHDFVEEPYLVFVARMIFMSGAILYFSYLVSSYRGLPNVALILFALIALFTFGTQQTTLGRRVYAVGGNEKAAHLSGIKTERITFYVFVVVGMLAALAGLIFAARLNTATPKAGLGMELDVIAACFIGGAAVKGGVGKIIGAVIGALVMGVMNNGMSILGVGIDWQQVIKGSVLLLAVWFDVYSKSKQ